MLPNFIGLGGNRCGSTWLWRNLRQHPNLCLPLGKELHFFNKDYERGMSFYEEKFASCAEDKLRGEITPAYLSTEVVASRICEHIPDAKLFVSLRDPVERAYSDYWRRIAAGEADETDTFEDALRKYEWILWAGRYYEHLTRYYRYFPQENISIIFFEDIKNSPAQLLEDLHQFLGVDPELAGQVIDERVNTAASIDKLARSKMLYYTSKVLARFNMNHVSGKLDKKNRSELPPMKPETRQFLIDYYRDDVMQLQDLLQRDLQSWLVADPA